MQVFRFHRQLTHCFDDQQLNMVYNQEAFTPFIRQPFVPGNLESQIDARELSVETRQILRDALMDQYRGTEGSDATLAHIQALGNAHTFTVTTGHQLSAFTGPLYFVLKIMHAIRLSEELQRLYPEHHFVPVYWMATEDHDFEEIRGLEIFGKTLQWNTEQQGAVGRFQTREMEALKQEIGNLFANHPEAEIHAALDSYRGDTLAEATRNLVNHLFGHYGLVIIDGDDPKLKRIFAPLMRKELETHFSEAAVQATSDLLKREGGKIQVNPRPVNLFYLGDNFRARIEPDGDGYLIEGRGRVAGAELLEELEQHPERFSPNVILRPLYQEMILPNLVYIGGTGEIAYWLQLKGVFDAAGCIFPLLSVRTSVMWVESGVSRRMEKINLHIEDVLHPTDQIKRNYILQHTEESPDMEALNAATGQLTALMEDMVMQIDSSKQAFVEGEKVRLQKQMDAFQDKVVRFSKARHEEAMKHIEFVRERLFPGDGLQERKACFFSFSPDGNFSERLKFLHRNMDPFNGDLLVIREY